MLCQVPGQLLEGGSAFQTRHHVLGDALAPINRRCGRLLQRVLGEETRQPFGNPSRVHRL